MGLREMSLDYHESAQASRTNHPDVEESSVLAGLAQGSRDMAKLMCSMPSIPDRGSDGADAQYAGVLAPQ